MTDHVRISDDGPLRVITLNRPEKKNAITLAMYDALADAFAAAHCDASIRVIVLAATGDVFTAGNDMMDFVAHPPDFHAAEPHPVARFLDALASAKKPFVVAVEGLAVGIGVTMLLHADLVYAGDTARFRTAFVDLGLVPEAGSSLLFPAAMGHARASMFILLGETLSAAEALSAGIVGKVTPAGGALEAALDGGRQLAAKSPTAVRETKRLLRQNVDVLRARILEEGEIFARLLHSEEFREAAGAFLQKRTPDFSRFS